MKIIFTEDELNKLLENAMKVSIIEKQIAIELDVKAVGKALSIMTMPHACFPVIPKAQSEEFKKDHKPDDEV